MTIRPLVPTLTNVAVSATSVTLFAASNAASRHVQNDASTQPLYIHLGSGAASTSSFTFKVAAGMSVDFTYNGAVTAIWGSTDTGAARCTELA